MIDVTDRVAHERARLLARIHRTDDGSQCTVEAIHKHDGIWAIHGLGNPGGIPG